MQLAVLESEFSPDRLLQQLIQAGWSAKLSPSDEERIVVVADPSKLMRLSETVASFIMTDWLSDYVNHRLRNDHPYMADEDREYVRLLAFHTIRQPSTIDLQMEHWEAKVRDLVCSVLKRSGTVNVRGVLRFRCGDFMRSIDYMLTDLVEHFLADKEYEEFVAMLRVMLESQPPSTQTLHVYCTNERVWISDDSGSLVRDGEIAQAAEQAVDEGTVDPEDLSMSILIMKSPCNIVIHDLTNGAPWPNFAETVERVFLDRASRCNACTTCERLRKTQ